MGLSAVLVNTQVVMVPLLAVVLDRETLSRRFLLIRPVTCTLRTGGVFETGATGSSPAVHTLDLIPLSKIPRRSPIRGRPPGPLRKPTVPIPGTLPIVPSQISSARGCPTTQDVHTGRRTRGHPVRN